MRPVWTCKSQVSLWHAQSLAKANQLNSSRTERHSPSPSRAPFFQLPVTASQQGGERAAKKGLHTQLLCSRADWPCHNVLETLQTAPPEGEQQTPQKGLLDFGPALPQRLCAPIGAQTTHPTRPVPRRWHRQAARSFLAPPDLRTRTRIPIPIQPLRMWLYNSLTYRTSLLWRQQLSLRTSKHNALRFSSMGFQSNLVSFFYEASEEAHAAGWRGILTNQLHGQARASANMLLLGKKKPASP